MKRIGDAIRSAVKPAAGGLVPGLVADLTRSYTELLTENALLRQQLIVLRRCTKRPKIRRYERGVMVVLAALTQSWRSALLIVKPETILRWHRAGFRLFWRAKSRTEHRRPRLSFATIEGKQAVQGALEWQPIAHRLFESVVGGGVQRLTSAQEHQLFLDGHGNIGHRGRLPRSGRLHPVSRALLGGFPRACHVEARHAESPAKALSGCLLPGARRADSDATAQRAP